MRSVFLAAMVLISAPAYSDNAREFSAFLGDYKVFADKRTVQSQSHTAKFGTRLTFRQCETVYEDEGGCECPPGNSFLQCLTSAQAVITTDPNDIGGRGYALVSVGGHTLTKGGQWVLPNTRGVHTAVIEPLGRSHTINITIPDRASMDSLCAASNGMPISFTVAYGAAMPMDVEFARRMKERSTSMGQSYDEQEFIFSRARFNGARAKKGSATAGSVDCLPPEPSTS